MNIVLVGMPGSGKTTVSRALSALTGVKLYDTDEEIVKKYGAINDIFENYGEQAFRNLETEAVRKVSELDGVIISTGGGCIMREENTRLFKRNGKIVFLRTTLSTLIKRIDGNTDRPLLKSGAVEKMTELLKVRTPVYEAAADYTVDTDGLSPEEIAKIISELTDK